MDQDWEEKKIRELFHEMRQADERLAPPFLTVREAALSRSDKPSRQVYFFRAAVTVSFILLLLGLAFMFFRRAVIHQPAPEIYMTENPTIKDPKIEEAPLPNIAPANPDKVVAVKHYPRVVKRPAAPRAWQSELLISRWQSPTDFLLKSPGDQLLMSVPRVNDSVIELKILIPTEKN